MVYNVACEVRMKIIDITTENDIVIKKGLNSSDDVLDFTAGLFFQDEGMKKVIFKSFKKREKISSTGVGNGIAIPHAICKQFPGVKAKLVVVPEGVPFNASDGKPVFLFVAIAANIDLQKNYLSLLSNVARIFANEGIIADILTAETPSRILKIVEDNCKV